MTRDKYGRFTSNKNNNENNTNKGENNMMNRTNAKENRMETLKANGINTNNFFNLSMNIPVGSNVQILIDGVPYEFNSSNNEIVKDIIEKGYVFNSRTDGRFVCAQTFKMLNQPSYNWNTKQYEEGWDAYLRNRYNYMYQFDMMLDEVHRLAKMERSNDAEFAKLSKFFTKEVVYETCNHYLRQLKKFVKNQPTRKCKGVPYVKLNKYGDVFVRDLDVKVYNKLYNGLNLIKYSKDYTNLETNLRFFMYNMPKLPSYTPKCSTWKDAFKGIGSFKTLNNIVKHHGVTLQNYETGELLDRDESVDYIDSLLETYKGEYWKFHELLKATIKLNNFDLRNSIKSQK